MFMKNMTASLQLVPMQLGAEYQMQPAFLDPLANDFWVHSTMIGSAQDANVGARRTAYDPIGIFGGTDLLGKLSMSLDVKVPVTSSRVACRQF